MSLFVHGAKLPKIDGNKAIKAEIRCIDGKWQLGIMTGGYYCSQEWTFYPLSELPQHGRLIDADELDKIWGLIGHDDLEAAPTIIQAEGVNM